MLQYDILNTINIFFNSIGTRATAIPTLVGSHLCHMLGAGYSPDRQWERTRSFGIPRGPNNTTT